MSGRDLYPDAYSSPRQPQVVAAVAVAPNAERGRVHHNFLVEYALNEVVVAWRAWFWRMHAFFTKRV